MSPVRRAIAQLAFAAALAPAVARAQPNDDGAYGRLDSDGAAQLDLGAAMHRSNVVTVASFALRYLHTVGLYACALDFVPEVSGMPRRSLSFGLELRPLFIPRFLKNQEHGPARWDLALDSVALRLGTVTGHDDALRSPGLEAGLGLGVPLAPAAQGPWISAAGALRWSHAGFAHDHRPEPVVTLTVGWQATFDSHLVQLRDPPSR